MYEFHGWITLRMSRAPDDETDSAAAFAQIRAWLKTVPNFGSCVGEWRVLNGNDMVFLQGFPNRPRGIDSALVDLFERVAAVAPGSYGLLYALNDDVHPDFQVWVLRSGKVERRDDPFFSPFVPTVEDRDEV
jgi:Immunity protein 7